MWYFIKPTTRKIRVWLEEEEIHSNKAVWKVMSTVDNNKNISFVNAKRICNVLKTIN